MSDASNALDPSIPLRAGQGVPPPQDFLGTAEKFMRLRYLENQNALFPGEQQIQQQSITRGDIGNQGAALGLDQAKLRAVVPFFGPALAAGENVTYDHAVDALARAKAMGFNVDKFTSDMGASMPHDGPSVAKWLKTYIGGSLTPAEVLNAATPTTANADVGDTIVPLNNAPKLGTNPGFQYTPGGSQTKVPSPEYQANPQSVPEMDAQNNPTGRAQVVPGKTLLERSGLPTSGRQSQQTPRNAPAAPSNAPAAPRSPSSAPSAPKDLVYGTTQAPGEADVMQGSAAQLKADRAAAGTFAARTKPLEYAMDHIQNADTGRGSEFVNDVKGYFSSLAPGMLSSLGIDPQKITDFDTATKYMAQYQASQPGAQSTDMGREMAKIANPSTHIDKAAAQLVMANALGMERMKQAATLAYGGNSEGYAKHLAEWNTIYDPRAFSFDKMSPSQKAATLESLKTPADKHKFTRGLKQAENLLGIEMGLPK